MIKEYARKYKGRCFFHRPLIIFTTQLQHKRGKVVFLMDKPLKYGKIL